MRGAERREGRGGPRRAAGEPRGRGQKAPDRQLTKAAPPHAPAAAASPRSAVGARGSSRAPRGAACPLAPARRGASKQVCTALRLTAGEPRLVHGEGDRTGAPRGYLSRSYCPNVIAKACGGFPESEGTRSRTGSVRQRGPAP